MTENGSSLQYQEVDRNSDYIYFASGAVIAEERIIENNEEVQNAQSELVAGKVVKVIQFENLPDNDLKSMMKKDGIELLDYIPNNAFIAFLPQKLSYNYLQSINVKAISTYYPRMKLDKNLSTSHYPSYVLNGERLRINIHPFKNIELNTLQQELLTMSNTKILKSNETLHYLEVLTEESNLNSIASISIVKFMEAGYSDPIHDKSRD